MSQQSGNEGGDETVRVLVVDDNPEVANLASEYLEHTDSAFSVVTETSPHDALTLLEESTDGFDCIVSDYEMPGMDGVEFHDAIRQSDSAVPFILFTSHGTELFSDCEPEGVTDWLQKDGTTGLYAELADRVTQAARSGAT